MDKTKLNEEIHLKILKSSELFLKKEYDNSANIVDALVLVGEIKSTNFNDVSEIYIYEEGFGDTKKDLKDTIVHLITSVIAFDYTDENIIYLKEIILTEDNKKGEVALDFFLKIGAYHEKFRDLILNFVENNVTNFTKNKLNIIAFYLFQIYDKNNRTSNLFKTVNKLHNEKYPSQKNNNPINSDLKKEEVSQNGNKSNPLEEFQEMLLQQHENANKTINKELYNEIIKTAEIIEGKEDKSNLKVIVDNLRERFRNEDLNQVTNLFIYCQSFLSTNEEPLPLPSQLCISIGKLFSHENLHYTASKVYSNDEIEGGSALSFLGYLAMHEQHTSYVLNFIKENFNGFSHNKKTECVFQLKETLPENEIAKQIVKDSGITKYELIFSTEEVSTSTPITFKKDNFEKEDNNSKQNFQETKPKSPWWKFW